MRALLLWILIALGAASAAQARDVRIAVTAPYPPFQDRAPDGAIIGLEPDILNTICARRGWRCSWHETVLDTLFDEVRAGIYDIGASALGMTATRMEIVHMTCPYRLNTRTQIATFFASTPQARPSETPVAVAAGSIADTALQAAGYKRMPFADEDLALEALLAGHAQVLLANAGYIRRMAAAAGLHVVGELPVRSGGTSFAVTPGRAELATALENELAALSADGTLASLTWRWLGMAQVDPIAQCRKPQPIG